MKNIFNVKSYFKFLSRNKVYTLIDIFGLSVSLMFVILVGVYYFHETSIDKFNTKADRIYALGAKDEVDEFTGGHWGLQSRLRNRYPEIESTCAVDIEKCNIKNNNGDVIKNNLLLVDSTFYKIFDFELLKGDRNTALDAPNKVVVSEECARNYFGNSDPLGKTIAFNDSTLLTVSGVMAPMQNTSLLNSNREKADMIVNFKLMKYFNMSKTAENENCSNAVGVDIYILCYPNTNFPNKLADIEKYFKSFFWIYSLPGYTISPKLIPLNELYFSGINSGDANHIVGDMKLVKVLFSVGLLILVFAIMNYINLTVALGGFRAKEMATHRLLGASRGSIIIRLIVESILLCTFSCIIGIILAFLFAPYASTLLNTELVMTKAFTPVSILLIVIAIILLGIISGIIPAILISSAKPLDVVRGTLRMKSKMVFSKVFIIFQNAITIILIAVSLTMILQIRHMINAPLGYDSENLLDIFNQEGKPDLFVSELRKLACVTNVSKACGTPFNGGNNNTMDFKDRTVSLQILKGDENYLDILGLKIDKDYNIADENGVYVNRQAIRELDLNLDSNISSYEVKDDYEHLLVRGVLKEFHLNSIESEQHPVIVKIVKDLKSPWEFLIKVAGNPVEAYEEVAKVYKSVYGIELDQSNPFMSQQIKATYDSQIRMSKIVSLFAAIAIIISLLGLLAMSTYFIQQRKKEMAIRKVFGCENREVLITLIRTFLMYVVVAFVVAVPIIYYFMTDWLSQYSYRIRLSWWIYAIAGIFCLLISFMTVFIQSYQAANSNPVNNLKQE